MDLPILPPCEGHELPGHVGDLLGEAPLGAEVAADDRPEDPVDRLLTRDGHVQDEEMPETVASALDVVSLPLEPLRDVVPAATRMDHGRQVAHVLHKVSCLTPCRQTPPSE